MHELRAPPAGTRPLAAPEVAEPARAIPGPTTAITALPSAIALLRDPRRLIARNAARWGHVWQTRVPSASGFRPLVWLLGPGANERVLSPEHKFDFSWHDGYRFSMEPMFGRDILLLLDDLPEGAGQDGSVAPACPMHRERHRKLAPGFSARMDADYLASMHALTERRLARWPDEGEIDVAAEMKQLSFHIAAHLLLGAANDEVPRIHRWFEEIGLGLFSVFRINLPGSRYRRGLAARRDLGDWLASVVRRYRAEGPPPTLLGHLVRTNGESGPPLSDAILIAEVISAVFAGYDTTASVLASLFLSLSSRPELYPRLRDEARALAEPSFGALQAQRHADAAIVETQRLHPPLPFSLRGVRRSFEFEGFSVPEGANVAISAWFTHRMPQLFPDPLAFRPERFLDGDAAARRYSQYELLPFGAGWRPCIGRRLATLELGLILNRVLTRFDLDLIPGQPDDAWFNPAMQRRHGVRLHVKRAR